MSDTNRVVITGGPSTGKTAVIEELGRRGFLCLPELVRDLTAAEKEDGPEKLTDNPIVSVKDPKKFNRMLLDGRIGQYESTLRTDRDLVFFDRGIPDVHAYMHCFGQAYDASFADAAHRYRYDEILLLPPWEEIFVRDGERFESYEQSVKIFESLKITYRNFGYAIVTVPKLGVTERADFILNRMQNVTR